MKSVMMVAGLAAMLWAGAASAKGVVFLEGSFEEALATARKAKKNIMVDVYATWCGPCKKQKAEVFETDDGLALTQSLVTWRVDFDAPATRKLMERWNVLSLPTILFLRPDGTEIDRIEGYDDKKSFLAEAERRAGGLDPLPELEKRMKAAKTEKDRLPLLVQVSHRRLVRGDARGFSGLEAATIEDHDGKLGAAEDALFLMGRYLSRVQRDFDRGRHVWRELYHRFPEGKYAATAAWWYAGAVHELGHDELAFAIFERRARARPKDPLGLDLYLSFADSKKVGKKRALALFDELKSKLPKDDRVELEKTAAKLR
jgi:thiol-disulfide isomerase/thioredoxin